MGSRGNIFAPVVKSIPRPAPSPLPVKDTNMHSGEIQIWQWTSGMTSPAVTTITISTSCSYQGPQDACSDVLQLLADGQACRGREGA